MLKRQGLVDEHSVSKTAHKAFTPLLRLLPYSGGNQIR